MQGLGGCPRTPPTEHSRSASQDQVRPLTRARLRWADARHRCSNGGGGAGGKRPRGAIQPQPEVELPVQLRLDWNKQGEGCDWEQGHWGTIRPQAKLSFLLAGAHMSIISS